jgi:hypothetical protein
MEMIRFPPKFDIFKMERVDLYYFSLNALAFRIFFE